MEQVIDGGTWPEDTTGKIVFSLSAGVILPA